MLPDESELSLWARHLTIWTSEPVSGTVCWFSGLVLYRAGSNDKIQIVIWYIYYKKRHHHSLHNAHEQADLAQSACAILESSILTESCAFIAVFYALQVITSSSSLSFVFRFDVLEPNCFWYDLFSSNFPPSMLVHCVGHVCFAIFTWNKTACKSSRS